MKTVSNTSSLMELAESRNNIVSSSGENTSDNGIVRLYITENDDNYYLYKDSECTEPATAEYIYGLFTEGKYVSAVFGGSRQIFALSYAEKYENSYNLDFSAPYWSGSKGYVVILSCYRISANSNGLYQWGQIGN